MDVLCPRHKTKLHIEHTKLDMMGITYPAVIGKCEKCRDTYVNRGLSMSNRRFNFSGTTYEVLDELASAYPAQLPVCARTESHKKEALSSDRPNQGENASPIQPVLENASQKKVSNTKNPATVPSAKEKKKDSQKATKKEKDKKGKASKKAKNSIELTHWKFVIPSRATPLQTVDENNVRNKHNVSALDIYTPEITTEMESRGGTLPAPQKPTRLLPSEITTVHLASETDKHFWITIIENKMYQEAARGILWSERAICKAIIRAIKNKKPWVYYNSEPCQIVSYTNPPALHNYINKSNKSAKAPFVPDKAETRMQPNNVPAQKPAVAQPKMKQTSGNISALDLVNGVPFTRKDIILYICKGLIACKRDNHKVIAATGLLAGRRNSNAKININYCPQCNKCFISYDEYQRYRKQYKILVGNIRLVGSSSKTSELDLAEESLLHLCGYSVAQAAGLTVADRRGILQYMMEYGIMEKPYIIDYLNFYIRTNRNNSNQWVAVQKWNDDLEWVRQYRLGSQPLFQISDVKRNR